MKKNKKALLWIVGVFALLLAIYLWVTMYSPSVNTPQMPEVTNTHTVFTAKENIISVKLQNTHGTFTFVSSDAGYYLKENNLIMLDQSTVSGIFAACGNLVSSLPALENAEDLSLYGLDLPSATVTITEQSGDTVFFVGDKISGDNGYYFKMANSPEVYVLAADFGSIMTSGTDKFRNMHIISMSTDSIEKLEIINKGEKLTIEKITDEESESYKWIIPSFMNKQADTESVTNQLLIPAASILATGIADENPSDYSAYGMDISVTVWSGESKYTYMGGINETDSFARIASLPAVYTVDPGTFAFADTQVFDILERYAYLVYLDDIDSVDVTLPSGKYFMEIHREGNSESYTINGKSIETQKFRETYQSIVAMYVDGIATDVDMKNSVAAITFHYSDGNEMKVAIYEYDSLNHAVVENGRSLFYMKKQILEDIEKAFASI